MTGPSFCVDFSIRSRASAWIKLDSGIDEALKAEDAGENWARLSGAAARARVRTIIHVHGLTVLRIHDSSNKNGLLKHV